MKRFFPPTLLLLAAGGCVAHVFKAPTTISTSSVAAQNARKLQPVAATATSYFFVLIPVPADPRKIFDDLLDQAKKVGGNAVVDVQVRSRSMFVWAFPTIVVDKVEATGTAAVVK